MISQALTELTNIEYMDFSNNKLNILPDNFGSLSQLSYLNLSKLVLNKLAT